MPIKQKIISIAGLSLIIAASYVVYGMNATDTASVETSAKPQATAAMTGLEAQVKGPLQTDELKHITLTDQDGKTFSLDELKGETLLVNFMFAACTSVCPVQTIGLRQAYNEMQLDPKKDRIKLLSISIAPLSDTPEQLKAYAKRFEIDKPSWRFAVTSQAHTDELSEQFGVGVAPLEGNQLDHRSLLYLINHEGTLIQQYRGSVVNVERLKKELRIVDQIGRS